MKNTTLCYIKQDNKYLMLHRVKKENDENKDKWIGVGGKLLEKESPYECAMREIFEETGLIPENLGYRAVITFVSDIYETEQMHLFTADKFSGDIKSDCDEGILEWVNIKDVYTLPIWEGDKVFLKMIEDDSKAFFALKLVYENDKLIECMEY